MYKIMIKHSGRNDIWDSYGTTSNDQSSTFTEFETDDVTVLKTEIEKLDNIYGHDSIRVIEDVTVTYEATIA